MISTEGLASPIAFRMGSVLALRNLIYDRTRLLVTLVGIGFAVALMNVEIGIFIGFVQTTSSLIDRSAADLWVTAKGTRDVDQTVPIPKRKYYEALTVPGVKSATRLNVEFADFRRTDGGSESVLVVGFDPENSLFQPWNIVEGDVRNLRYPGTILIDEFYRAKLGVTHLGQTVEISGRRARVVGFTRGIRSFTQSPYVFASSSTALTYSHIRPDQTMYVLVKLQPNVDMGSAKRALAAALPDVDIISASQFSAKTRFYWMFTTGAGLALLIAAFMGLLVGAVVISQTLYATTVDHLPEFGTLRAIGASDRYLYAVIMRQAILSGIVGYTIGWLLSEVAAAAAAEGGPAIILSAPLVLSMLSLTMFVCCAAAIISIKKVMHIDPGAAFR